MLNEEDIIDEWRDIVEEHGIQALRKTWAEENGYEPLYQRGKYLSLTLEAIAGRLGKTREFLAQPRRKIEKPRFDEMVREVIAKYGCLPCDQFLHAKGYPAIPNMYVKFYGTMPALRKAFGVDNIKLQAINGMYMDSMAEVCYSNYLEAHGIKVLPGGAYPEAFAKQTGKNKCRYDPGFVATNGPHTGQRILVEIFGVKPKGQDSYAAVQAAKTAFHEGNPLFLALLYSDCYKDDVLAVKLEPFIGRPERITRHERLPDAPAVMLSYVDDALKRCQEVCDKLPDGQLPSSSWFNRAKCHKDRERYDWEPLSWDGLTAQVSNLGWKNVRALMVQSEAQNEYLRNKTLDAVEEMYKKFGLSPWQIRQRFAAKHEGRSTEEAAWCEKADTTIRDCIKIFTGAQEEALEIVKQRIEEPAAARVLRDDTMQLCQDLCDKLPDGLLPGEHWFRKVGIYADRDVYEWEPNSWSLLMGKIHQGGGYVAIRAKMVRSEAQKQFEMAPVLKEVEEILTAHGMGPKKMHNRLKNRTSAADRALASQMDKLVRRCNRLFEGGEPEAVRRVEETWV